MPDPFDPLKAALADRYAIERELRSSASRRTCDPITGAYPLVITAVTSRCYLLGSAYKDPS